MGAGGLLRDEEGNLIRGFKTRISASSHLDAELQALSLGLELVRQRDQRFWIELGDQEVVAMLIAEKYGSANTRHRVTEIRNKLKYMTLRISFIPKEGNKVAIWLAEQGSKESHRFDFNHNTASARTKAMVRMDQIGMPNFQFG